MFFARKIKKKLRKFILGEFRQSRSWNTVGNAPERAYEKPAAEPVENTLIFRHWFFVNRVSIFIAPEFFGYL